MGIFKKLFGRGEASKNKVSDDFETSLHGKDDVANLKKVIAEFRNTTMKPTIKIKAYGGKATTTGSKFGGKPYFPKNITFPVGQAFDGEGQPMKLLAQLNFAEIPHLDGYPDHGLLQFFIIPNDLYGADFDDETTQKNFRIIYHENLDFSPCEEIPEPDFDDGYMPFEGEYPLKFELSEMPMLGDDFRCDETFISIYQKYFQTDKTSICEVQEEWENKDLFDAFYDDLYSEGLGHRIGGYASFTQTDPREFDDALKANTELLLQVDSEQVEGVAGRAGEIMWGDMGVANFFISPDDLKNHDFSRVAYNWDCG